MKIINNGCGEYEIIGGEEQYDEIYEAQASGRVLLEGSRDYGYDQEYLGYGDVNGIPVKAVYLLAEEDYYHDNDSKPSDDAGDWDWDAALEQGRLVINEDKLSADALAVLRIMCP